VDGDPLPSAVPPRWSKNTKGAVEMSVRSIADSLSRRHVGMQRTCLGLFLVVGDCGERSLSLSVADMVLRNERHRRCCQCLHRVILKVDHVPCDLTVISVARRMPFARLLSRSVKQ
jgi:hypothetical protein